MKYSKYLLKVVILVYLMSFGFVLSFGFKKKIIEIFRHLCLKIKIINKYN